MVFSEFEMNLCKKKVPTGPGYLWSCTNLQRFGAQRQ